MFRHDDFPCVHISIRAYWLLLPRRLQQESVSLLAQVAATYELADERTAGGERLLTLELHIFRRDNCAAKFAKRILEAAHR